MFSLWVQGFFENNQGKKKKKEEEAHEPEFGERKLRLRRAGNRAMVSGGTQKGGGWTARGKQGWRKKHPRHYQSASTLQNRLSEEAGCFF